jgi:hypothetical protein
MQSKDGIKLILALAMLVAAGVIIAWQLGAFESGPNASGLPVITPAAPEAPAPTGNSVLPPAGA